MFNRTEAKWLLEAWLVVRYAHFICAQKIRLNHADPPDAYAKINNSEVPIEITEVMEPGRPRGLEFRPEAPTITMDPGENWVRRAEQIPGALRHGIEKKLQKRYPADTRLFIYLNIGEYGIRQRQIEAHISSVLTEPTHPFAGIDIMWKEKLFRSDGPTITSAIDDDLWDDD